MDFIEIHIRVLHSMHMIIVENQCNDLCAISTTVILLVYSYTIHKTRDKQQIPSFTYGAKPCEVASDNGAVIWLKSAASRILKLHFADNTTV